MGMRVRAHPTMKLSSLKYPVTNPQSPCEFILSPGLVPRLPLPPLEAKLRAADLAAV